MAENAQEQMQVNPILQAANAIQKSARETETLKDQQRLNERESTAASRVIEESVQDKARDQQLIALTSQLADMKAQNDRIAAFESAGGIDFLKELNAELASTTREMIAAQNEVESITENAPKGMLGAIAQEFKLLGPTVKLDAAQNRVRNLQGAIAGITNSQESISRAVATAKKSVTTGSIDAGQRAIAEQANIDAANARLDAIRENGSNIRLSMSLSAADVASKLEMAKLRNTETNQAAREKEHTLQVAAMEQRSAQFEEGRVARELALERATEELADVRDPKRKALLEAQRDAALADIQDKEALRASIVADVQVGQTVTGNPVEQPAVVMQQVQKADVATKRKYNKLRQVALREDHAFGLSPADALETVSITGADPKLPPIQLLSKLNTSYMKDIASDPARSTPKTQEAYNQEFDAHVKPIISAWKREIKEGDASNPFQAPSMVELRERADVKSTELFKKFPAFQEMKEFAPRRLYDAAVAGIASKEITLERAALDLETIFNAAVDHNNETKMFSRIGIAPQTAYNAEIVESPDLLKWATPVLGVAAGVVSKLDTPVLAGLQLGFTSTSVSGVIDNTDRTQIMQALNKIMAQKSVELGGLF